MTSTKPPRAPIESKVFAATAGSVAGTAIGGFVLWLLGVTVWNVSSAASQATNAVAAVPGPVSALLLFIIGAVGTAFGGYVAPHTPRPTLMEPSAPSTDPNVVAPNATWSPANTVTQP